jgi:glutathione S-transferase
MKLTLYVVHGSHPCAAVLKATERKGLRPRVIEWPPAIHAAAQRLLFGARTVPALTLDGEKIVGSRAIMHRLDELAPEPALYPADPDARARVTEADRWGDEVLQPYARVLLWAGFSARPDALASYGEHSRLPVPAGAIRAMAPGIAMIQRRLNGTDAARGREALRALAAELDHADALIASGVIGDGARPNAADLQIASTLRLLMTMDDVRPLIETRPCGRLALAIWPQYDGRLPAGAIAA